MIKQEWGDEETERPGQHQKRRKNQCDDREYLHQFSFSGTVAATFWRHAGNKHAEHRATRTAVKGFSQATALPINRYFGNYGAT
jgi:hypothetical protein